MTDNDNTIMNWLGLDSREGRLFAGDRLGHQGLVGTEETVDIVARPWVSFRPQYLWVDCNIASCFIIHRVRVGNRVCTASPAPLPASIFAIDYSDLAKVNIHEVEPDKTIHIRIGKSPVDMPIHASLPGWKGVPFELPICNVGVEIGVLVENIAPDKRAYRFLGAFLGEAPTF